MKRILIALLLTANLSANSQSDDIAVPIIEKEFKQDKSLTFAELNDRRRTKEQQLQEMNLAEEKNQQLPERLEGSRFQGQRDKNTRQLQCEKSHPSIYRF